MKIRNFEYFASRVARKFDTVIQRSLYNHNSVWFANGMYMDFDGEFLYISECSNGVPTTVMSCFVYCYNTQKDFFHDLDLLVSCNFIQRLINTTAEETTDTTGEDITENTEQEETEEASESEETKETEVTEEIRTAFIKAGWSKSIKFAELTMEEAEQRGLHFATSGIKSGKKYFKMLPSGNIFDSNGEMAYFNIIGR